MLSSAVIVFREVFEVVLILGIILAATRGMPHRKKAIYLGFAGGLLGSFLVAVFMDKISALAEGLGQEIFNAGILLTAAAFIGGTVIWMKRHAHEMKSHFAKVGEAVSRGEIPFLSLSVVIALAILREGSEIALFTYGMLASGQSPASLIVGSLAGLIAGAGLGILLYAGLIRISMKYFFRVTSALLMLLVAGMVSQAMGFLTAAGAFEGMSQTVWNTSWLLSESGLAGQSLKALIGYTAQPSLIQLVVYICTLGGLIAAVRFSGRSPKKEIAPA
ncbi:MAG: FTR1 family protein [Alphaproteobacteria bacterium]|nr:FTR1 family protein [Alphaproteobacteria bacterium]